MKRIRGGTRNTKLYVVGVGGGEPENWSEGTDYDLGVGTLSDTKEASFDAVVEWAADSSGCFVQIGWKGDCHLGFIDKSGTKNSVERQLLRGSWRRVPRRKNDRRRGYGPRDPAGNRVFHRIR